MLVRKGTEKGIRGSFHICESIFQNIDCNIDAFSLQSPGGRSNAVLEHRIHQMRT